MIWRGGESPAGGQISADGVLRSGDNALVLCENGAPTFCLVLNRDFVCDAGVATGTVTLGRIGEDGAVETRVLEKSRETTYTTSKGLQIPLAGYELLEVGDEFEGTPGSLPDGSFFANGETTAVVYGGTIHNPLSVLVERNAIWRREVVDRCGDGSWDDPGTSVRVKFVSYPTPESGYVVASVGRTMRAESSVIYRATNDADGRWELVGTGPRAWLLQSAGFVSEEVGLLVYRFTEGFGRDETFLYRTQDGGRTFSRVELPPILTNDPYLAEPAWPETTLPFVGADGLLLMEVIPHREGAAQQEGVVRPWILVSRDGGASWALQEDME